MLIQVSGDIEWKFHIAHNSVTSPLALTTRRKFHVAEKLPHVHTTYVSVKFRHDWKTPSQTVPPTDTWSRCCTALFPVSTEAVNKVRWQLTGVVPQTVSTSRTMTKFGKHNNPQLPYTGWSKRLCTWRLQYIIRCTETFWSPCIKEVTFLHLYPFQKIRPSEHYVIIWNLAVNMSIDTSSSCRRNITS